MSASFGSKTFEVSTDKIYTPSDISLSESLSYEEQERAGDKPAIYIKALGALSQTLTVKLDARWVDVQQEGSPPGMRGRVRGKPLLVLR